MPPQERRQSERQSSRQSSITWAPPEEEEERRRPVEASEAGTESRIGVVLEETGEEGKDEPPFKNGVRQNSRLSKLSNSGSSVFTTKTDWSSRWSHFHEKAAFIDGPRGCVNRILLSMPFDILVNAIVIANVVFMIFETDQTSVCLQAWPQEHPSECLTTGYVLANHFFLACYLVETSLRLYALRGVFFRSRWNLLDGIVVLVGYFEEVLNAFTYSIPGPSTGILRIFRVLRVMRAVRVVRIFPELYTMLRGFLGAMMSMVWGFLMLLVLLIIWSIVCVELLGPATKRLSRETDVFEQHPQCKEIFDSVWNCILMLFQTLVAGDSWGRCALPIIQDTPAAFVLFAIALVCVQLGLMNLILAVIVDRGNRMSMEDAEQQLREKQRQEKKAAQHLRKILTNIDEDGSGTISLSELMNGYDYNKELRETLALMDIDRSDLSVLFELMDIEGCKELKYDYLINQIARAKSADSSKQLLIMRLQTTQCLEMSRAQLGLARAGRTGTDEAVPAAAKGQGNSAGGPCGREDQESAAAGAKTALLLAASSSSSSDVAAARAPEPAVPQAWPRVELLSLEVSLAEKLEALNAVVASLIDEQFGPASAGGFHTAKAEAYRSKLPQCWKCQQPLSSAIVASSPRSTTRRGPVTKPFVDSGQSPRLPSRSSVFGSEDSLSFENGRSQAGSQRTGGGTSIPELPKPPAVLDWSVVPVTPRLASPQTPKPTAPAAAAPPWQRGTSTLTPAASPRALPEASASWPPSAVRPSPRLAAAHAAAGR